jgi:hypothetical protein
MTKTITVKLPDALVDLLGPPEHLTSKVREMLVLNLRRDVTSRRGSPRNCWG